MNKKRKIRNLAIGLGMLTLGGSFGLLASGGRTPIYLDKVPVSNIKQKTYTLILDENNNRTVKIGSIIEKKEVINEDLESSDKYPLVFTKDGVPYESFKGTIFKESDGFKRNQTVMEVLNYDEQLVEEFKNGNIEDVWKKIESQEHNEISNVVHDKDEKYVSTPNEEIYNLTVTEKNDYFRKQNAAENSVETVMYCVAAGLVTYTLTSKKPFEKVIKFYK